MSFRDNASFGKKIEYKIEGELSNQGYDVYLPIVDDHGVDCVVKKSDGVFVEIQIKGRSKTADNPGHFYVDNHESPKDNFYFIFYSERVDTTWVFSSKEFCDNAKLNKTGRNAGRKSIDLVTKNGKNRKEFEKYIVHSFDFLKQNGKSVQNLSNEFEVEFCLKKTVYCEIYHEDGSYWDRQHKEQLSIFHELFKTNDGQGAITADLQVLFMTYFNDKGSFYNSFTFDELPDEELKFLKEAISNLKL